MNLSKYDLRFVQNILDVTIKQKSLTTNQVSLFDKILGKYKRQLNKHSLNLEQLKSLPWTSIIVPSEPQYTEGYIWIEDDMIYFKAPFNKNFISSFRQVDYNPFIWDKVTKRYFAPFSTYALQILQTVAPGFYPVINHCPITTELLTDLVKYDTAYCWNPTLVNINNTYLIAAINEHLAEAIKDITLGKDMHTLALLAEHGIDIHPDIIGTEAKLKFASEYLVEEDLQNIHNIATWLKKLGCDMVQMIGWGMLLQHRKKVYAALEEKGILVYDYDRTATLHPLENAEYGVVLNMSPSFPQSFADPNAKKIVLLRNSTAIDIK